MSDTTTNPLQLTQAILQRRLGVDTSPHEPNVLLIEGVADRGWVTDLGRQGLARVEEAMAAVTAAWQTSDSTRKASRLESELMAAESAEGDSHRRAAALEKELAARLDGGEDASAVEDLLASEKSDLARLTVRASVLRHLLDKARARARDQLRRNLEATRLQLHQQAREEHQTAVQELQQLIIDRFPAVNRSGYVFSLTNTADVTEHHLRLAGFEPVTGHAEQNAA